jgi:hypothetical protein
MKLKELFFGYTDGEEEAMRSDFVEMYFNHNNLIENSAKPEIYAILGRRGTGKTVLSYILQKKADTISNFVERVSYGELTTSNFKSDASISEDEYFHLFQWVFLLELSKIILKNISLEDLEEYKKLEKIYKSNFSTTTPHSSSYIQQILNNGVKFKFPLLVAELEIKPSTVDLSHKNISVYTEYLKNLIAPLLLKSIENGTKYLILLDDIDDHISLTDLGKQVLKGLITSVSTINKFIRNSNSESKILIFLRTDVFQSIKASNSNKIKDDHSLTLDWSGSGDFNSPLYDIIYSKLKTTHSKLFKGKSEGYIFSTLFEDSITIKEDGYSKARDTDHYILSKTFYRPRDLVKYLNLIKNKYGEIQKVSAFSIMGIEKEFSYWLKSEVELELSIHYNREFIVNLFSIASRLNTARFGIKRLKESYESRNETPKIDIAEALILLYKYGVLGQFWTDEDGKTNYRFSRTEYDLAYENPNFLENNFIIHSGLKSSLLTTDINKSRQNNSR